MRRPVVLTLFILALTGLAALTIPSGSHSPSTTYAQSAAHVDPHYGAIIYKNSCASCHDQLATHAPPLSALRQGSPEATLQVLKVGSMKAMASSLSEQDKRLVTEYVTGKTFGQNFAAPAEVSNFCANRATDFGDPSRHPNWIGWSPGLSNTRFQADPGLAAADIPKLKLRWAFGIPGAFISNAQPAVANGHLFLGTAAPAVYSLNAKTGCTDWIFRPDAAVRNGITIGKPTQLPHYAAFFGDGRAFVYAVDAGSGRLLWKINLEQFPSARITGSPVYYEDRLYVPIAITEEGLAINPKYECCRSRPSIVALDAATGKVIWRHYNVDQVAVRTGESPNGMPMWGPSGISVWSAPTLDPEKKALYVGTGNNFSDPPTAQSDAIMALSMNTGQVLWTRQVTENDAYNVACVSVDRTNCPKTSGPDSDFGSSPMLIKLPNGKRALIAGQKSGVVTAVDPDDQGKVLWQVRVGKGGLIGGVEWGTATDGSNVYAALSDMAWVGLNVLDPRKGGGIYALHVDTGKRAWFTPPDPCERHQHCSPAQSAAVTAVPGAVFSGSEDGHMRAYSTQDGHLLWDFDTVNDFQTIDQIPAKGGSIDGPGPTVADGMVYVSSGYPNWGGLSGNVLLAFSVDGK